MTRELAGPDLRWLLGCTLILYVAAMYALSLFAQRRIRDTEDFLLAGRRLPLSLAWATLLATWFGAGTVLTAADEVRQGGIERAALDPLGAGFCLLIAGLFFAGRLWKMRLSTLSDFFRRRFGPRAELLSACIMVPSYFGWIAAQFVAMAEMLRLFFEIPLPLGILLVAAVGMGYTLLGGMWSVTLTDAVQIVLLLAGLVILGWTVLGELGQGDAAAGLGKLIHETPGELLRPLPADSASDFLGWLSVFLIGALGNVPGQDLMQRIFASRSARVARQACWLAGGAYLGFGAVPLLLGLAARLLFPEHLHDAILPTLARSFLSPALAVVFTVALTSAILSTIDSAILSPASVLAQNVFSRFRRDRVRPLARNRLAVVVVTLASLAMAYLGESAYSLLESAYLLPLVGLFVPLSFGLYGRRRVESSALAAMVWGCGLWLLHLASGWESFLEPAWSVELPVPLAAALASLLGYVLSGRGRFRRARRAARRPAAASGRGV